MSNNADRLTTPQEVEDAFVRLFRLMDDKLSEYIGAAENGDLKAQALRNVDGMLEIFKTMNQSRYLHCIQIKASDPVYKKRSMWSGASLRRIV